MDGIGFNGNTHKHFMRKQQFEMQINTQIICVDKKIGF